MSDGMYVGMGKGDHSKIKVRFEDLHWLDCRFVFLRFRREDRFVVVCVF